MWRRCARLIGYMPDLNDFHAFKSTSSGGNSGGGNSPGCFTWILVGLAIIWLIGKMAG